MSTRLPAALEEAILEEYEVLENIDVEFWTSQYPEHREGILQYVEHITGGLPLDPLPVPPPPPTVPDPRIAEAIRRHMSDLRNETFAALAERARRQPRVAPVQYGKKTRVRSAATAVASDDMARTRAVVTRKPAGKGLYLVSHLLHPGLDLYFTPGKHGPYCPDLPSLAGDAAARGWLFEGTGLQHVAGPKIEEARETLASHLGDLELWDRSFEALGVLSDRELDVWATIHWAAQKKVLPGRRPITIQSVRDAIEGIEPWRREHGIKDFSDAEIRGALAGLVALGLLPQARVQL